jgi:hypothetical protein
MVPGSNNRPPQFKYARAPTPWIAALYEEAFSPRLLLRAWCEGEQELSTEVSYSDIGSGIRFMPVAREQVLLRAHQSAHQSATESATNARRYSNAEWFLYGFRISNGLDSMQARVPSRSNCVWPSKYRRTFEVHAQG